MLIKIETYSGIGIIIGLSLILFRKSFANAIFQKQIEDNTGSKAIEYKQQIEKTKSKQFMCNFLEIVTIAVGMIFVLGSIAEFFPKIGKYIIGFIGFSIISFFAVITAIIIEYLLFFKYLWKKVHEYATERYNNWEYSIKKSSDAVFNKPENDPMLHRLQKQAVINSIMCFVLLFVLVLFIFCAIIKLTS